MIAAISPKWSFHSTQLVLINVETSDETVVGEDDGVVGIWTWSSHGERIIFAGEPTPTWQLDFFEYTLATKPIRRLTTDLDSCPHESWSMYVPPTQPTWLDDERLLFAATKRSGSCLSVMDTKSGEVSEVGYWDASQFGLAVDVQRQIAVQSFESFEN